jgi:nicotinamidase-related amidase
VFPIKKEALFFHIISWRSQVTENYSVSQLEDFTSPAVIPDIVDYTEQANAAFQRFIAAGMQMIQSFSLLS